VKYFEYVEWLHVPSPCEVAAPIDSAPGRDTSYDGFSCDVTKSGMHEFQMALLNREFLKKAIVST
jgi:hypothetical protein